MSAAEWSTAWPTLAAFVTGVIVGATLIWDRAWLTGKRQGYAWGREDQRVVCRIEHPRKERSR
jgi:hypothetical protein